MLLATENPELFKPVHFQWAGPYLLWASELKYTYEISYHGPSSALFAHSHLYAPRLSSALFFPTHCHACTSGAEWVYAAVADSEGAIYRPYHRGGHCAN